MWFIFHVAVSYWVIGGECQYLNSALISGWAMHFLLMTCGVVQMVNPNCVAICNYLLFLNSHNNLNLIFTDYSSITALHALSEIVSVAVTPIQYKYLLYGLRVYIGCI